jgi:hypothetical protein
VITIEVVGKPPGGKLIRVSARVKDGVFQSVSIRGDFFASPEEGFDNAQDALAGTAVSALEENFACFLAREGVETSGITPASLAALVSEGILSKENGKEPLPA